MVGIGGVGVYPTMVMNTTDLNWLVEVVGHEWTHNFLTLRPLGINYDTTPELRTINETTASIAGKEWSGVDAALLPGAPAAEEEEAPPAEPDPPEPTPEAPAFNFRKEMRVTRLTVDDLLAKGEIDEAEAYMEAQRRVFWDQGYQFANSTRRILPSTGLTTIRRAGPARREDPVGPAVQECAGEAIRWPSSSAASRASSLLKNC